jgi:hypothetical protein
LTALLDPKERAEKTLLEALQRDYLEERQTSEVLQKESDQVPYAHLRRKLLDIAAREQEHAELLAAKIRELGGEPRNAPPICAKSASKTSLDARSAANFGKKKMITSNIWKRRIWPKRPT